MVFLTVGLGCSARAVSPSLTGQLLLRTNMVAEFCISFLGEHGSPLPPESNGFENLFCYCLLLCIATFWYLLNSGNRFVAQIGTYLKEIFFLFLKHAFSFS